MVPITSACNLDCPICYTVNRNEGAYRMSAAELDGILGRLRAQHDDLDIINFTGGEPTLHPELPAFLRQCQEAGIRRLTVSTNGLRLRDPAYVRELAEVEARVVLSLDTFDPAVGRRLLGAETVRAKLEVLDLLAEHDVTTTLLPAVARGQNDHEVGALFDLMLRRPHMVSLEIHPIAFSGQGGSTFDRAARLGTPDLHALLEAHTGGGITGRDFVPSPLAHPLCYSICYLLVLDDGGYVPFSRLLGRERLFTLLERSLYLQPNGEVEEALRWAIDELWADPDRLPGSEGVLRTLRRLVDAMFPEGGALPLRERRRIAERATKAIYIHAHMDAESFDVGRVMRCSVGVPEADGSNIPTCSYNVLYRERDGRFVRSAPGRALPVLR